jgi:hypothetical protein
MRQTLSETSLICMHGSIEELTGNAITPDVHSEGGRATEAFGGGGARRQDRPGRIAGDNIARALGRLQTPIKRGGQLQSLKLLRLAPRSGDQQAGLFKT